MLANKQSTRSLVSFLVAWSFVILTVTGIVLYIVPHGRVAYWVHWSLAGMEKDQWGWVHMMFGGVFIVSGVLHLYFNWKTFMTFLAARAKGHVQVKREVVIATLLTVLIFVVSAADLPPASWVIDLNDEIKGAWVTSPELEPPFGHAEEVSLAGLARRQRFDADAAMALLQARGIEFDGRQDTLEAIARRNRMTPMDVYAVIRSLDTPPGPARLPRSRDALEAELAGTGLGRKTVAEVCAGLGVDPADALARLRDAGIAGAGTDKVKAIAEQHAMQPIDLVALMLGIAAEGE